MDTALTGPRLWLTAVRAYAFPASVVPLALGTATAWSSGAPLNWALLPPTFLAGVLLHSATNLLNDRDDYLLGVDRPGTRGGCGLLVSGRLSAATMHRAGLLCLLAAALIGLPVAILRGWPLLVLGGVGALGAWGYTAGGSGYKYRALGDPLVGLLMGPLMVLGAHLALGGPFSSRPLLASIPIALLVTAILAANNLRDIEDDRGAGISTLAILLGRRGALVWYLALLLGSYVVVAALCATRAQPWISLLPWLGLPVALRITRRACRGDDVVVATAQHQLLFGTLLTVSVVLTRLL
jgi:1,4-dihydroxy-2-naphthoate polyprenyltransferase